MRYKKEDIHEKLQKITYEKERTRENGSPINIMLVCQFIFSLGII